MEEVKVSMFFITVKGDDSVGLPDQQFTLEPDFYFEDQGALDNFKEDISQAFENAFGEPTYIETAEELKAREELEILQTEQLMDDFDNGFADDIGYTQKRKLIDE